MRKSAAGIVMLVVAAAGFPGAANAQRGDPNAGGAIQAPVTIDAKLGGQRYQASGNGECKHAAEASIRGVSAALWTVEYSGAKGGSISQLNLTLWRPKDGGDDQLSLLVETKGGTHRIQMDPEGKNAGEGSVAILPNGPGGRFEINGKDASGKELHITIDCPAFAGVVSEGG